MELPRLSPDTHSVAEVVRWLELEPLPHEGGFFRRIEQAEARIAGSDRRARATILFLLGAGDFSALHRLDVDETWHHEAGDGLELWLFGPAESAELRRIGAGDQPDAGHAHRVPAGTWQGARLVVGGRWALVRCVTEPEFDWGGFELADRAALQAAWPRWAAEIEALTR